MYQLTGSRNRLKVNFSAPLLGFTQLSSLLKYTVGILYLDYGVDCSALDRSYLDLDRQAIAGLVDVELMTEGGRGVCLCVILSASRTLLVT